MIKVGDDGRTLYIHRGDAGNLNYSIPLDENNNYKFVKGDIIRLSIFDRNSDFQTPLKEIKVTVDEESTFVSIPLTSEDTNIGEPSNKKQKFAYEVSLNGVNTTLGYDEEEGPAILELLPAKGSDE